MKFNSKWLGLGLLALGSLPLTAEPILQYPNKYDAQLLQSLKGELHGQPGNPASQVTTLPIHFADPKSLSDAIHAVFPTVLVAPDLRQRAISVCADGLMLQKIKKMVTSLDQPVPQIRVEVRILEVSTSFLEQHKELFSQILNGVSFHYDSTTGQILTATETDALISHLLDSSEVKILARPTILTLDGNKASIMVGEEEPYLTQIVHETFTSQEVHQADSGITFDILPKVVSKNQILADVNTEIAGIKEWKSLNGESFPVISRRKTTTKVYLKPGETLVIAGLYSEQSKNTHGGVPWLKDLPWIGGLFSHSEKELSKSDVLFFLTPHIE